MGRLFWKCFLATWVTLILAGAVTLTGVHLYRQAENRAPPIQGGPRAAFELAAAETVLRHAGAKALAAMLEDAGAPMIVLDPQGRDIRGRTLSAQQSSMLAGHANSVMSEKSTRFRRSKGRTFFSSPREQAAPRRRPLALPHHGSPWPSASWPASP